MAPDTQKKSLQGLALAALGIVFGDIGTSPLYAFEQVFANGMHSVPLAHNNIYGVLSLFFWSLMLIVTIKYVFFIMRADNHGEGGIMALMALAMRDLREESPLRRTLLVLGLLGAAFFYGDGVITPAISVLSAVEGLELISPKLKDMVLPIALTILLALFWSQKRGTGAIGRLFGPVMLVWFVLIGGLGFWNILQHPGVLVALNPFYALDFLATHGLLAFFALGAVVLCLTGAEALYADMGHFGPLPIRIVWVGLVLPALVLNYFGQGALLLTHPEALSNLFYLMAPDFLQTPLVIIATIATVIASQAVISGAFSMTRQAYQLGFLPHLLTKQTSAQEFGQVYLPIVNILLAISVVAVILLFQTSNALGSAYGIAVTGTMLITDFLAIVTAITIWRWQPWRAILGAGTFIVIDAIFFSSNSVKFFDGGWLPIAISIMMVIIMTTWNRGRLTLLDKMKAQAIALCDFISHEITEQIPRAQGAAIYIVNDVHFTPIALKKTLHHFGTIHEQVVVLGIHYVLTPYVSAADRVTVTICGKGFMQIRMNCGFMEKISIPEELKAHWPSNITAHPEPVSYFISSALITFNATQGMRHWRRSLYRFLYRNSRHPQEFFNLPVDDSMAFSVRVDI
ncbi:MAG: potassium transporter Kup [Fluviibacter sp.]